MTANYPSGDQLHQPCGNRSQRAEFRQRRRALTIAIQHLDGAHDQSVRLFETCRMLQGAHGCHLRNHLLFDDTLTTDLFEEGPFFLVGVGA